MMKNSRRVGAPDVVVRSALHPDARGALPLVYEPSSTDVDLPAWAEAHRAEILAATLEHGALLFHGFELSTPARFESVAQAICPDLFADYGDLPKEHGGERIYKSTPYPNDMTILYHNESSHLPRFPLRQFFGCMIAPESGGETPLLDCRTVYRCMDPVVRGDFESKGLLYTRTFAEGLDVTWQDFFKTESPAEVESQCADAGLGVTWTDEGYLRLGSRVPAVTTHPMTGERSFFNQVQLHHISCLDPSTRGALLSLFSKENLPRNVYYGDGSDIDDETIDYLGKLFDEHAVILPWSVGDMIMLDNIITSHGRRPFTGSRKIVVALAEQTSRVGDDRSASNADLLM